MAGGSQHVFGDGGEGSYEHSASWADCQILSGAYRRSCVAHHPELGAQNVDDLELALSLVGFGGAVAFAAKRAARMIGGFIGGLLGRGPAQVAVNRVAGNAFADDIARAIPGARQGVGFRTRFGQRYVDVLTTEGVAIEAKVGRTALTKSTRRQLAKDAQLLRNDRVEAVVWVFKRSEVTGKGGPTKQLQSAIRSLQARGLKITWAVVP